MARPAGDTGAQLETLLGAFRDGEDRARDDLCRVLLARVLPHLERQMGPRPRRWLAPDDLAQIVVLETLADVERLAGRLTSDELLRRLHQKAQWRIRDAVRNHRREVGESALPVAQRAPAADQPSSGPVTREDDRRWLAGLVERLPKKYADVVCLCGLEGRSYAEAGALLKLAPGTVRKRYERAKRRLADRVARNPKDLA